MNIQPAAIILEPFGRNTAPAIALAALTVLETQPDAVVLVCPSDHWIPDLLQFRQAVELAAAEAKKGAIVTFGIKPTEPITGYGYIESASTGVSPVTRFIEKPSRQVAEQMIASDKNYYWNSGMFVCRADTYLNELKKFAPDIDRCCRQSIEKTTVDLDFTRIDAGSFQNCPNVSIDYAVMEHTSDAVVVPMNCDWSDLGTWSSVRKIHEKDDSGNVVLGDVKLLDTTDCLINSNDRLVAVLGCNNLAIIDSRDALLVLDISRSEQVKDLVENLVAEGRPEATEHRRVYRPWGDYEQIDTGNRYQVKRIVVKPGGRLSLQRHHHRAEHWVVVTGTARVTCGDKQFELTENQSTFIPLGEVHRLENPGHIDLEIIEVQSGSYLGEDDIVRLDDEYGRLGTDSQQ